MKTTSPSRELKIINKSLESIQAALRRLGPALASGRRASATTATQETVVAPRRLTLTPARRAALKVQGQYMGFIRGLAPAQKKRVKALAAKKGMAAGAALARKLARG